MDDQPFGRPGQWCLQWIQYQEHHDRERHGEQPQASINDNTGGHRGRSGERPVDRDTAKGNVGNASGTYGQAATVALSATVTANSPSSAVVNEGTVTFAIKQGMTPVATVTSGTVAGGAASANLSLSGIGAGTYSIGATYNPAVSNPNFDTSTSATPGSLTIGQASSTTTVTGGSFVYDGSAHAATVSVTGAGGLSLTPAPGYSGSCSTAPTRQGQGTSCTASYTYAGDANHTGSNGSATVTITQASTTTLAIGSGSIVGFKDLVTLSAKVTPATMESALTGYVAFKIGSGTYGSATR